MIPDKVLQSLVVQTESKLVMVVIDGIGGLPVRGKTELEAAKIPNLNRLASKSVCGLIDPISYGIPPGRGVMEALGIGLELTRDDLTARGNFATIDQRGIITDRRAGRIPTERNQE